MGLVATMATLLLAGLLVSSAKGTYDTQRSEVIQMAARSQLHSTVSSRRMVPTYRGARAVSMPPPRPSKRMWPDELAASARLTQTAASEGVLRRSATLSAERRSALKARASTLAVDLERADAVDGADGAVHPEAAADHRDGVAGDHLPEVQPARAAQRHHDSR